MYLHSPIFGYEATALTLMNPQKEFCFIILQKTFLLRLIYNVKYLSAKKKISFYIYRMSLKLLLLFFPQLTDNLATPLWVFPKHSTWSTTLFILILHLFIHLTKLCKYNYWIENKCEWLLARKQFKWWEKYTRILENSHY